MFPLTGSGWCDLSALQQFSACQGLEPSTEHRRLSPVGGEGAGRLIVDPPALGLEGFVRPRHLERIERITGTTGLVLVGGQPWTHEMFSGVVLLAALAASSLEQAVQARSWVRARSRRRGPDSAPANQRP